MISSFATHLNHQNHHLCPGNQKTLNNINSNGSNGLNGLNKSNPFAKKTKSSFFALSDEMSSKYISRRKIGIWQLVAIAYFTTAGGPYGLEVCVRTGGFIITLIGLLIMPILYATPQALMTAELSNMMPENGGYVIWVFRAFGDFLGYINAYNAIICNLFDNAIYPTLIMEYYHILYPNHIHGIYMFILKEIIVILGCIVNIQSIRKLGNYGIYTTLLILLPFTLGFIIALPSINWDTLEWGPIHTNGTHEKLSLDALEPNMALFFSTLFWCHTGL